MNVRVVSPAVPGCGFGVEVCWGLGGSLSLWIHPVVVVLANRGMELYHCTPWASPGTLIFGFIPASAPSEFIFLGKTSFARATVLPPWWYLTSTVCDVILPQFPLSVKHDLRLAVRSGLPSRKPCSRLVAASRCDPKKNKRERA